MKDDFTKLRLIAKQLIETDFRHGWQSRIEITSPHGKPPSDFDIYVKDITYDPIEIETEAEKIGGHTYTWPISSAPVTMSMTVRDNVDLRIRKWFQSISGSKIVNIGKRTSGESITGTINLVQDFVCTVTRWALISIKGEIMEENSYDIWKMIPTKLGEITDSREEPGHVEFPITFIQHRTDQ